MLAMAPHQGRTTDGEPLGTRLRAFRQAKGWRQVDLGASLGVTSTTVSRWERGRHRPRRGDLHGLGRALDCPSDALRAAAPPRHGRSVRSVDTAVRIARALADIAEKLRRAR
jgi:transcriptional regulator with XRE-family HTH domain